MRLDPADPFEASALSDLDLYLFAEGTHRHLGEKLGAHPRREGPPATRFCVWAPNAQAVSVAHDRNGWRPGVDPLEPVGSSGLWHGVIEGVGPGTRYKYCLIDRSGSLLWKADPVAAWAERPPGTASVVWDLAYHWGDQEWMAGRQERSALGSPVAIYEVHLGSWRRDPAEPDRLLSYGELADPLIEHVLAEGFTHVELLPIMEHPFSGSWGYQVTGYFAPTARHGTPQDFMALVDRLHQAGIGVILDWVPSHFPLDEAGLARFDGTHLYEHADSRQGYHPDWGTAIFNYDRHEVRAFLLSSAHHWLGRYHVDGLRVDAVASMLYLDYSRPEGQWVPNALGGRENLGAVAFLQELNRSVYAEHPGVQTYAEESTAWPQVSWPTEYGGLGFGYKWDMGWMHDTLRYLQRDPVHRRWHHHELTFRSIYADSEHFVLPLSHDEVVHGKGSLLGKMPGDDWQKRANLRLLYGYQWAVPGKKLLFQGQEIGQWAEWDHDRSLDWHLLEEPAHQGIARFVALHQRDCEPGGLEWVLADDAERSLYAFLRRGRSEEVALVVLNATPVPRQEVTLGVPLPGPWRAVLNGDRAVFGGSGMRVDGRFETDPAPEEVEAVPDPGGPTPARLNLIAPPLAACWLVPAAQLPETAALPETTAGSHRDEEVRA
jgi:1,4-alpha-glucan branching enzyme